MKDTIATIAPPKNENIVPMIPMIAEITVIANPATAIKPATPATTATITAKIKNMAHQWIKKLAPDLMICDLDRSTYQNLLNQYAAMHERQTTMDFHHHLKCTILDVMDELVFCGFKQ